MVDFPPCFCKGDNSGDFRFAFLHPKLLLKGVYSERKEFALLGANSFLLMWTLFQKGASSLKVY